MDIDTAVKGIISVRERITKSWEDPVALSDLGNKMTSYAANLGDHLGKLEEERETTRATKYLQYIKSGASATASENRARAEVAELTGKVRKLKLMHSDAHAQVSIIQSRLRVIENQIRGEI